ncbi:MAG TPA: AGE family epimerase/isomerase [Bacteroidales bacterium]|nr:AGE family epimerase/isomerase [Bacteroidales bacterium]
MTEKIRKLHEGVQAEILHNILPFWSQHMTDHEFGGFLGRISGQGRIVKNAEKGGILNARILWTFSAAYNHFKDPVYRQMAERSKDFILKNFFDEQFGGTYWKLTHDGNPLDTKKQIYSQAFFIYALSEYYRISGDRTCLDKAVVLHRLIEEKSSDVEKNGYLEAFTRDWTLLEDLRLSDKDDNEKKTTNTHLHILEAYTGLYRIWKDRELAGKIKNLLVLFLEKILDPRSHHLQLFFDDDWNVRSSLISYGHDIEASWLLYEAARVLEDRQLMVSVKEACIGVAHAAMEGLQEDGSLIYEKDGAHGRVDMERHWWPQAEAVVGMFNLFEITSDDLYLTRAIRCWEYIVNNLTDKKNGEWYWSIFPDGTPNLKQDKAGFWKCPYHNGRMCLEIIGRSERIMFV